MTADHEGDSHEAADADQEGHADQGQHPRPQAGPGLAGVEPPAEDGGTHEDDEQPAGQHLQEPGDQGRHELGEPAAGQGRQLGGDVDLGGPDDRLGQVQELQGEPEPDGLQQGRDRRDDRGQAEDRARVAPDQAQGAVEQLTDAQGPQRDDAGLGGRRRWAPRARLPPPAGDPCGNLPAVPGGGDLRPYPGWGGACPYPGGG